MHLIFQSVNNNNILNPGTLRKGGGWGGWPQCDPEPQVV